MLDYNLKFRIWDIDDNVVKDWEEQTALPASHKHKTVTEHYGYAAFDFSSEEDHQKSNDEVKSVWFGWCLQVFQVPTIAAAS